MVLCGFCYRPLTPQSGRMRECWYDCVIVIRDVFSTSSFFYHSSLCCHCSSIHFRLQLLAREPLKFFRTGVVSFVFSLFLSRCREFYLSSMGQYSVVKAFRSLMRRENLPNFVNVAGFKWMLLASNESVVAREGYMSAPVTVSAYTWCLEVVS